MSAPAALLPPPWRNDLLSPTLNSRWRRKTTREEEKKASKQRASSGDSLEMRAKKKERKKKLEWREKLSAGSTTEPMDAGFKVKAVMVCDESAGLLHHHHHVDVLLFITGWLGRNTSCSAAQTGNQPQCSGSSVPHVDSNILRYW